MQNIHVTDDLLKEMTDAIVREVHPRKVILFGSYARGSARTDSDLDLLVVEDGPFNAQRSRRAEMTRLWKLLRNYAVAKDFLVYAPEEVAKWEQVPSHVICHAMREGKVLYECP